MNLFDALDSEIDNRPVANDTWRPEPPPSLSGIHDITINFETTGLRWFDRDKPIAVSIATDDRSWYLPWGHRGAGNLSEEVVREYFRREIRDKKITNINTRFEAHMARTWGIDLESQGNTVSDIGHTAALLDDHRLHMNLDSIIRDFLGEEPMVRLDESRMVSYSAGQAMPRARYNVEVIRRLMKVMYPKIKEENLEKVQALEDKVIYPVCEMEKNGTLINHELLHEWIKESLAKYHKCVMEIYKRTGLKVNPNSGKDVARLFKYCGLEIEEFSETGLPSFTDDVIKVIKHPDIKLLRYTRKLKSVHGKMCKYRDGLDDNGILRYALHQLRSSKSEGDDEGETGTVTGRFSSTEITDGVGINIQQVLKPEKQFRTFGDEFFVRELHIPEKGKRHLASDAEQIQYRIFADMAKNPQIMEEYRKNPRASFHRMMHKFIKVYRSDISYPRTKDTNFAKMFAAGLTKLALMLGEISKKEFLELRRMKANGLHPKLQATAEVLKIYKRVMPEGDLLLKRSSYIAETQGHVTTLLGRRIRFPDKVRLHKALNGEIQGSEADIVKTKLVEVYEQRDELELTLRFQVHDELDGDVTDEEHAKKVDEVLNTQSFPQLQIPILWKTTTGISWGDCSRDELAELRKEANG